MVFYKTTLNHTIGKTYWTFSFICLAVFTSSAIVEAEETNAVGVGSTSRSQWEICREVLKQLREGNIEQGLKRLENVADAGIPISLAGEDGLATACAGLHRVLSQLSSEAQFDLLEKWTLPADSPQTVRVLTTLVPTFSPPVEFARALGERPRSTSFPVSSIGEIRGVFSTAWSLVVAARDCGRLKRLIAELEPLVDKKVPNADLLMTLARIVEGRADKSRLAEQLSQSLDQLKGAVPQSGMGSTSINSANILLALAALQEPRLRPLGEQMLAALLATTEGPAASQLRPFLRRAQATAMLVRRENAGELEGDSRLQTQLKYWISVSGDAQRFGNEAPVSQPAVLPQDRQSTDKLETANGSNANPPVRSAELSRSEKAGLTDASWLAHDDHLLHLSGSGNDQLMLRYPLLGEFGFQFETQFNGRSEANGHLIYGGLGYQVLGTDFRVTRPDGAVLEQRPCPFLHPRTSSSFNRLSIVSSLDSLAVSVNQHPMGINKSVSRSSPWLGLGSTDESRPLFRNLKLSGQPVIPRSVRLIDGPLLSGWQPQVFGDRSHLEIETQTEWRLADGVLGTKTNESTKATQNSQQVLYYQRPLLDGEIVSYEFLYKPGECEVTPTLGRVAFLLQPDGVRLRWLTLGPWDWTGLADDNAVTEPLNRRGPRPLPLRVNEWNRVTMARTNGTVTLSLGDVVVYQRKIDWSGDFRFGLVRPDSAVEANIRDLALTGDWPQTLPQEFLDNPMTTIGEPMGVADRHALNRLFGEEFLTENVFEVRRLALAMPAAERFEFLSGWILPGPDHPGFRVSGDFTATHPAPKALVPGVEHPERGGQIVSPILDWIKVARELGRLDECRERVEAAAVSDDDFQKRARVALLLLIGLEQQDAATNEVAWGALFGLLKNETNAAGENHWPETLVATRAAENSSESAVSSELLSDLALQRMLRWQKPDISRWHTHVASLHGKILAQRESTSATEPSATTDFRQWIPVSASTARTAGSGHPNLSWIRRDNRVVKVSGHDADYLYYQLPLSGNYQIECDFVLPNLNPVAIMTGGTYIGPLGSYDGLDNGSFRAGAPPIPVQPKLTDVPKPMRYRGVIHDGVRTVFLNGRKVLTTPVPPQFDPWIAIRCPGRHRSSVENFRILGQPTVLETVSLSHASDLTGWLEYYEEGRWKFLDKPDGPGWIVGHSDPALAGTFAESLLRYQRPLVEDGSIEYEFFYKPGVVESSPVLDRLAFLLHPSGVREHWVTDDKYDPVGLRPDNVIDIPENRRGPGQLPLMADKWNRLVLSLRGNQVNIQLNGELIYERELDPLNQRSFGLFHYVDATEARVRQVVMRGDWPKQVPAVREQELAGKTTEWIDTDLPRLKSVFTHSFEKEGLPEKYFELPTPNHLKVTPDGIQVTQVTEKEHIAWDIVPRFALSGDFDIETAFAQIKLDVHTQYCGIMLRAILDDPKQAHHDLHRIMTLPSQQLAQASVAISDPSRPGAQQWWSDVTACETDSGRLRLARRGKKLFYLFAEGDSKTFHLFGTEPISESDTIRHGVRLQTFAVGGNTSVVWKSIILRAERMTWFPVPSQTDLFLLKVVQADGTGLRTIAAPSVSGYTHVGSPEWSSDGRKITMDMSNGATHNSHIIVMNADGTERRDLGLGCMPSFSGDGKRIAFSEPGQGIMTMKSDGTDRQVVDRAGWGTQWSPDGKWIAYGKAGNITLLNVASRKSRQLLVGNQAMRYGSIYWNLAWSHDSRGVAFKGRTRTANKDELAFAEVDSPDGFQVLQADATSTYPDISFSPDSKQVIASIDDQDGKGYRLHAIDINAPGKPKLVEVIPDSESIGGVAWSRDGKSIAISVLEVARPTEWVTGMKTD